MPKIKLTSSNVALLECEPGKKHTTYWDNGETCPGLTLEVRQSGSGTFQLRYRTLQGEQRVHKIAKLGELTFDEVRREARRLKSLVVLGGDPSADKAVIKAVPTYGELAVQHLAHAATYQRSYSRSEQVLRVHLIPKWGKTRLTDITTQGVTAWLAEKAKSGLAPATVEKIRVIMSRSFNLGAKWGVPGSERNPVKEVPRRVFNNARQRFLSPAEVQRLREAAAGSRNKLFPAFVDLALLTGARRGELLSAEWSNLDLDRQTLLLPMTKNGRSRHLALSKAAVAVIEGMAANKAEGARYLFPSPADPTKHMRSVKHAWQEACRVARLPHTTVHDMRHTAASAMIAAGVDLFAVGKVLGHQNYASTMRYSHLANDKLLAAVDAGAAGLRLG